MQDECVCMQEYYLYMLNDYVYMEDDYVYMYIWMGIHAYFNMYTWKTNMCAYKIIIY